MKRSVNEYDENRGGGYSIPPRASSKNQGEDVMGKIAMGMGVPAGAALVAGQVGRGDREAAKREQEDAAKREADAEMKRESRGIQKPSNFDAMEESKRDAQDARDRKKISSMGYKNGGYVRAADGIAKRGRTRGKMV
jgi:hypothetical protein